MPVGAAAKLALNLGRKPATPFESQSREPMTL
jgi:hypothetical protein